MTGQLWAAGGHGYVTASHLSISKFVSWTLNSKHILQKIPSPSHLPPCLPLFLVSANKSRITTPQMVPLFLPCHWRDLIALLRSSPYPHQMVSLLPVLVNSGKCSLPIHQGWHLICKYGNCLGVAFLFFSWKNRRRHVHVQDYYSLLHKERLSG